MILGALVSFCDSMTLWFFDVQKPHIFSIVWMSSFRLFHLPLELSPDRVPQMYLSHDSVWKHVPGRCACCCVCSCSVACVAPADVNRSHMCVWREELQSLNHASAHRSSRLFKACFFTLHNKAKIPPGCFCLDIFHRSWHRRQAQNRPPKRASA